jgi:thiol-disulfide isomerase/thioredoxin
MKKMLTFTSLLLVLALLAGCALFAQTDGQSNQTSTPVTSSASTSASASAGLLSSFTATDLDGNQVDESIFADHKLTMINIWATFCSPCINEMPELGELNAEYAGEGFQVVGIAIDTLNSDGSVSDSQVELAREIVDETDADYLHHLPSSDLIRLKLNQVTAVPETIFVDSEGNQVGTSYLGARSSSEWAEIIEVLLNEVT